MAVERHDVAPPSTNQLCVKTKRRRNIAEKINSSCDDIRKMKGAGIFGPAAHAIGLARGAKHEKVSQVPGVNRQLEQNH
jgi:hypothetical protein